MICRMSHVRQIVYQMVGSIACCLLLSRPAAAQPNSSSSPEGGFFAVDLFGGTHPESSRSELPNPPSATYGWEIGSTVRFARHLGIYGGVGRVRTPERDWITHVQVGPRVSSPLGPLTDLRGFAHVLIGRASSRFSSGVTADSIELLAGGGLDALNVFRIQLDYVRRDLPSFPRHNARLLFGVAIPLCFQGCRPGDGFAVSRHSR